MQDLTVIMVAGEVARATSTPKCHCPFDPDVDLDRYEAWCYGWEGPGRDVDLMPCDVS